MVRRVLVAAVFAAVIALVTFPYWGSCDLKYRTCAFSCDVRHRNEGIKKAACRAECYTRKVACISRHAVRR